MKVNPYERFYQMLVELQFRFMLILMVCVLCLHVGTVMLNSNVGFWQVIGGFLYYAVYPLCLYSIKIFQKHKHILDNIHLYAPKENNPKPYSNFEIHLDSPILTDGELKILHVWADGKSVKQMDLHPMVLNRLLRKYVKATLKMKDEGLCQLKESSMKSIG